MSELINEVPEVEEFFNDVINNINKYKLYPKETFVQFSAGIMATSSVDLHNECIPLDELYSIEKKININKDIVWLHVEHNPLIQPLGRIIKVKVFYSKKSDVYFLAFINGNYDIKKMPSFKDIGIDLKEITDKELNLSIYSTIAKPIIAYNPNEINSSIIEKLLSESPKIISKKPAIVFRKAAEPITIFQIISLVGLFLYSPLTKKISEKIGEKTANEIISFYDWIKSKVIVEISKLKNKTVLFEYDIRHKDCRIEFVIASKDINKLKKAVDTVYSSVKNALKLFEKLQIYEVKNIVYEFNLDIDEWVPLYVTTIKKGVISDSPVLVALERYKAVSISGVAGSVKIVKDKISI